MSSFYAALVSMLDSIAKHICSSLGRNTKFWLVNLNQYVIVYAFLVHRQKKVHSLILLVGTTILKRNTYGKLILW